MSGSQEFPIQEYSIHLYRCACVNTVLSENWSEIENEFNLIIHSYNEMYDWCVKEIFNRILQDKSIRIIGHYRWDEGRCIVETYMQTLIEFFSDQIKYAEISRWSNMDIKMMVFGSDVFIARPVEAIKHG